MNVQQALKMQLLKHISCPCKNRNPFITLELKSISCPCKKKNPFITIVKITLRKTKTTWL
uniref:Uncharacterized protein n=1 Tax=Octopus bimaculoides TaxID=37653 RepID=A0A0L8HY81_OCTBM